LTKIVKAKLFLFAFYKNILTTNFKTFLADQQLNYEELKNMLMNPVMYRKFEKLLNKKSRVGLYSSNKQAVNNDDDLFDQKNRKNYDSISNRKMKLHEEFKKKEFEYFLNEMERENLKLI
jgi:hypothetical protein